MTTGHLLKYRYELLAELARTDTFITWKAMDRVRGVLVVVRMLRHRWRGDDRAARRWALRLGEQRSLADPTMPAFIECGRDDDRLFFVRELVEGPTLEQWMSRPHRPAEVLATLALVAERLAAWHAAGRHHGRLHPGNIVLGTDGPVFTDWDVAGATEEELGLRTLRARHQVYLAPEVQQQNNAQAASDVYSLGVALYELLTGRRLGPDGLTRLPRGDDPKVPASAKMVVEGMVRPEPDDRYPAAQAAEALRKLRGRAEPEAERTPRELRRQRARSRREEPRKPLPWPVVVILVFYRLLFILVGTAVVSGATLSLLSVGAWRYLTDSMPPEVIVPDVVGMPRAEAKELFEEHLKLKFQVTVEQASRTVPKGAVISTQPLPGRHVKEGRTVQVVISSGRQLVTVPRLEETNLAQAQDQIERLGLKVGYVQQVAHDALPAGAIVKQSPAPGRRVDSGTQVSLKVSKGPPDADPDKADEADTKAAAAVAKPKAPKRSGTVRIAVPPTPRFTQVRVVVRDDEGDRTVYNELHSAGDVVQRRVEGVGETVVEVYLNDNRVETKVL